jgi:hypothetical protein
MGKELSNTLGVKSAKSEERANGTELRPAAPGAPPCFSDVWQTKNFKSRVFGCVANTGVMGAFSGCVAKKGLTVVGGQVRRGSSSAYTGEDSMGVAKG